MVREVEPAQPRIPEARGKDGLSIHRRLQGQYRQITGGYKDAFPLPGSQFPHCERNSLVL